MSGVGVEFQNILLMINKVLYSFNNVFIKSQMLQMCCNMYSERNLSLRKQISHMTVDVTET